MEDSIVYFIYGVLFLYLLFLAYVISTNAKKQQKIREQMCGLANNSLEMTPAEFFEMRSYSVGGRGKKSYARTMNFAGVYILHNKTKDLYYVGQGKAVLDRVNHHFSGRGNRGMILSPSILHKNRCHFSVPISYTFLYNCLL